MCVGTTILFPLPFTALFLSKTIQGKVVQNHVAQKCSFPGLLYGAPSGSPTSSTETKTKSNMCTNAPTSVSVEKGWSG